MPESLALTTTRAPETVPMPVMMPPPLALSAPSSSCMLQAGERREFEERRAAVEQKIDAVARQKLAALCELLGRFGGVGADLGFQAAHLLQQLQMALAVGARGVGVEVDSAFDGGHAGTFERGQIARPNTAASMRFVWFPDAARLATKTERTAGWRGCDGLSGRRGATRAAKLNSCWETLGSSRDRSSLFLRCGDCRGFVLRRLRPRPRYAGSRGAI